MEQHRNSEQASQTVQTYETQRAELEAGAAMRLVTDGAAPFLIFPSFLELPVQHGFSTRLGGVSEGIYASMNLGFGRGDEEARVRENYHRICAAIGIEPERLVFTDQVHHARVRVVTEEDCGKGYCCPKDYTDVDAHITNCARVPLLVFTADCVPIFLADRRLASQPNSGAAIGLVHAGWRGTAAHIVTRTIEKMREVYGTKPEDLLAGIGPCICAGCYEVDEACAAEFRAAFSEEQTAQFLHRRQPERIYKAADQGEAAVLTEKYSLNLVKANELLLLAAGVPSAQITSGGVCTSCRHNLLFSHRASKGQRGSMAGFLQIR